MEDMTILMPLVGAAVRSTEAEIAFEFVWPVRNLVCKLLRSVFTQAAGRSSGSGMTEVRLILTSDWQYGARHYPDPTKGRPVSFVFIGLPASEMENPLLIPLAGHEIGHAVWSAGEFAKQEVIDCYKTAIELLRSHFPNYKDMFLPRTPSSFGAVDRNAYPEFYGGQYWITSLCLAVRQAEEIFCDSLGLRLFGNAYLHAFAYVASPQPGKERPPNYPDVKLRASHLCEAAAKWGIAPPDRYMDLFREQSVGFSYDARTKALIRLVSDTCKDLQPENKGQMDLIGDAGKDLDPQAQARFKLISDTSSALAASLADKASDVAYQAGIPAPAVDAEEQNRICDAYDRLVPYPAARSFTDLLNAAWNVYLHPDKWLESVRGRIKKSDDTEAIERVLKDIVLKNIEIFTIEQIPRNPSDPEQDGSCGTTTT